MTSVHDVAAYILWKQGPMTAMKLQKLVYYSQAWSLVWDDEPLFADDIEAWANGPVVTALYMQHRGMFRVATWPAGNPENLEPHQAETVDLVLDNYGKLAPHELSALTHEEPPWLEARGDLPPGTRGSNVISHATMSEYYGSLSS
jgi:uncharacterized phage-associated protein